VKYDAPLFVYSDYLFKEIFKSGKRCVIVNICNQILHFSELSLEVQGGQD